MNEWKETLDGYITKTIKRGNITLVVHRPKLTEAERAKREKQVLATLSHCKSLAR